MVSILHISDLHFGAEQLVYAQRELEDGLNHLFQMKGAERPFVLITGDIIFQGKASSYKEARSFIQDLMSKNSVPRENLLFCPGNHDIVKASATPFAAFDAFSYGLRLDNTFTYSKYNHVVYETDTVTFLSINTAHRFDHQYGSADIAKIQNTLSTIASSSDKLRIAFLHHHLINQFESDVSALRNAYNLLVLLDENRFDYIFHGHQHSNQSMPIGEARMRMFGVRSFNFETSGYSNGFNYYRIEENSIVVENYTYSRDALVGGKVGGLEKHERQYPRERKA